MCRFCPPWRRRSGPCPSPPGTLHRPHPSPHAPCSSNCPPYPPAQSCAAAVAPARVPALGDELDRSSFSTQHLHQSVLCTGGAHRLPFKLPSSKARARGTIRLKGASITHQTFSKKSIQALNPLNLFLCTQINPMFTSVVLPKKIQIRKC
jgi:hypothetical protein